ncbi:MAG TPA: hypothetical protein VIL34_18300 [Actinopolymorphaceae bacterium]|jgi:hypothetical protein
MSWRLASPRVTASSALTLLTLASMPTSFQFLTTNADTPTKTRKLRL